MSAAGQKLGDAYIQVTADASKTGEELSRKVSRDLEAAARRVGETFDEALTEAVENSTEGVGDALGEELERASRRAGGRFAEDFSKQLGSALSGLPDVQLEADSTETDRALDEVRRRIAALRTQRIGIDVSAGAATTELGLLQERLHELGRGTTDVTLRADTAAAAAELAAAEAEVRRLDGQTANVDVRVNDSGLRGISGTAGNAMGGLSLVTAAALAVSPALIPIGAAALAGLGAIGPLAASAGAGLAVLGLGFSGVSDTVSLLGKRQDTAALQAATSAGSQVSSANQVAQATAALANTQQNAADSAVRAAETISRSQEDLQDAVTSAAKDVIRSQQELESAVTDAAREVARAEQSAADAVAAALRRQEGAEDSLTRALRTQQQAQLDLTSARRTAEQQIEDLASSVVSNTNAQRQAALDVAEAELYLGKVRRSSRAKPADLEAAQLAYDVELQRQKDLQTQGRRLAEQQEETAAKGVDGSDVVVDAQQRLVDANERVQDAQESAADAAAQLDRARLDGAEAVARAQEEGTARVQRAQESLVESQEKGQDRVERATRAVSDAIRDQEQQARQSAFSISQAMAAVSAAGASAGAAGGSALAGIDQQLAKVNPATLRFAQYVQDTLQPAWERMKGAAAAGLLPGAEDAINKLLPLLPQVEGFLGSLGTTLGGILGDAATELSSPFWVDFFTNLQTVAGPALEDMSQALLDVLHGLGGIVEAFFPFTDDVGGGITDLTGKFAAWGEQLGSSEGFHEFIAYVQENWPKVQQIISDLATVVGTLVDAGDEAGGGILTFMQDLTGFLAGLSAGELQAVVAGFLGFQAVAGVTSTLGDAVEKAKQAKETYTSLRDGVTAVKDAYDGLPAKLSTVGTSLKNAASSAGSAASSAASTAGRWVSMAASATVSAAKVAGQWALSAARTIGSLVLMAGQFVVQGAAMAASAAVSAARVVASWVLMGAQSLIQAARMAAAWLIAMGPIGLAIAAVVGIVALVVANWDKIKEFTIQAWEAVSGAVSGAIDAVVGFVKGLPQRALDALSSFGSMLASGARAAWQFYYDNVIERALAVVGWVAGLPGRVIGALSSLGSSIAGVARSAWQWFNDTVVERANSLVSWVTGLPGSIAGAIGNLGSLLYSKGLDLMQGLVNGISAAASFVGNVGRNIVNSVIGFVNSQVIGRVNDLLEFSIAGVRIDPPDIPRIPLLADGAIVQRATLAVVGEAGPEAVIPLSPSRSRQRRALMEESGLAGNGGGAGIHVDASQTYIVRDTQTAQEVGAVVGQRVVRDIRQGVSGAYTAGSAA